MALDLLKLATPLEPIILPTRTAEDAVRAVPLDAEGWAMLRQLQHTPDHAGALALLRRCIPDATDDDLGALAEEDVQRIILYCARKIRVVEEAMGESSAGAATTAPASTPGMTSTPSSDG
jgi:hypothetical protein